jgi:hypothetical protein
MPEVARQLIAGPKPEPFDQLLADVGIFLVGEVAGFASAQKADTFAGQFQDS